MGAIETSTKNLTTPIKLCFLKKKRKPIKGDIELLSNQIAFFQLFQPLRGWTVKHRLPGETRDIMVDFILRGLCLL